jgi:hypothetical protein
MLVFEVKVSRFMQLNLVGCLAFLEERNSDLLVA